MNKSEEILTTVRAFMGTMCDGDMRGVAANLQDAMEYQAEEQLRYVVNEFLGRYRLGEGGSHSAM